MIKTPIGRLRVVAFVEGCSYLALLGVAMPLKYCFGMPIAVKIVGLAHGLLFIAFCLALLQVMIAARWPLRRAIYVFASSLIPFGTFYVDGQLRRESKAANGHASGA